MAGFFDEDGDDALDVGAEVFAEFDGVAHGVMIEWFEQAIGILEAVEDEGEAGNVGREFVVEAEAGRIGEAGEIDVVVEPGCPMPTGGRGAGEGVTIGGGVEETQVGEKFGDGFGIGGGGGAFGFVPVAAPILDVDRDEAFDEAIVIAGVHLLDEGGLDAADDGDDGVRKPGRGFADAVGEDSFGGPEGEIALAFVATVAGEGTDEAVEFIAMDGEAGGVFEEFDEGIEGVIGGEEVADRRGW